jgi:hypothetical protein
MENVGCEGCGSLIEISYARLTLGKGKILCSACRAKAEEEEKQYRLKLKIKENAPEMERIKAEIRFCIELIEIYTKIGKVDKVAGESDRLFMLRQQYLKLESGECPETLKK